MDDAKSIIDRLRLRVAGIQAAHQKTKSELVKATEEKERLLQIKKEMEARIAELEHRNKVLELSNGVIGVAGGAKSARDRINKLLREVDKCIALMNK